VDGRVVPLVAAGFGVGCLLAAKRPPAPSLGWALLAGAAVLVVVVYGWGSGRRRALSELLSAAGLTGRTETPAGPRERILAAAGLPGRVLRRRRSGGRVVALSAAAVLSGSGWAAVRAPPSLGPLDGRSVRFTGTAVSDVNHVDWGWSLEIRLDRAVVDGRAVEAQPKVWATGSGAAPAIAAGQPVAGTGTVEALPRPAEDFEAYLLGRGVTARLQAFGLAARGPPENAALRVANAVRDGFRRGADAALPDRDAGLIRGLAIGDTEGMDPEVEEDFRATGLTHLLAVSGETIPRLVPVRPWSRRRWFRHPSSGRLVEEASWSGGQVI
jgi:competence protein